VLELTEVPKPTPEDDEVVVKVYAASLNSWDWDNLCGKPLLSRVFSGLRRPKRAIPGADVAGRVESVGKAVTQFKPGDLVFGDLSAGGWGALAEFVRARATELEPMPARSTFEEAAAVPQAGVMALQGIRDYGAVGPGRKVLINGAGGGVGTFAVQLAKSYGAEVTGVDRASKLDLIRSVGADHAIDFMQADFTTGSERYDLILDVVGRRSIFDCARALTASGQYVMVGGAAVRILQLLLVKRWFSMTSDKRLTLLIHVPNKDLATLRELVEAGTIAPVLDRHYAHHEVPAAFRRLGEGEVRGKAVITVAEGGR
jgi:NADPH:quinone reductase-like Zn-dependent oxidoreductase